jgi:hypothetical protein
MQKSLKVVGSICLMAAIVVVLQTQRKWLKHLPIAWVPDSILARNYPDAGLLAERAGDDERAIRLYKMTIEMSSRIPDTPGQFPAYLPRLYLGKLYLRMGRNQEALDSLQELYQMFERRKNEFPGTGAAPLLDPLAVAQIRLGKSVESEATLRKFVEACLSLDMKRPVCREPTAIRLVKEKGNATLATELETQLARAQSPVPAAPAANK